MSHTDQTFLVRFVRPRRAADLASWACASDWRRRSSHHAGTFTANVSQNIILIYGQHVGQGANQSFEDIDLLVELLEKYNPFARSPSTVILNTIFSELEKVRIPRSSEMVNKARTASKSVVVHGVEANMERNKLIREQAKADKLHQYKFGQ